MRTKARTYTGKSDARIAGLAAESFGVVSVADLRACGLDDDAIAWRVDQGRLHRIYWGVYAVGHPWLTHEGRWLAAVKACGPDAVLSHRSSLMLHGVIPPDDRRPVVSVPEGRRRAPKGIRVHRSRNLDRKDTRTVKGIRATSPERSLLDVAATVSDRELRRMMSRAQSLRLTDLRWLAAILDRTPSRPGRARFARVLPGGPRPTRSELEDRVLDLIRAGGFATPDVDLPIVMDRRRVVPDFRWPEQRLCVEADGYQWHGNPQARAEDAERQALLEASGERVLRVTWEQAVAHIAQTQARLAAAGAPKAR